MKAILSLLFLAGSVLAQQPAPPPAPEYPRPLRDLNKSYFPFSDASKAAAASAESWPARAQQIRDRILLACGLYPLPTKTPLNAVIHGKFEREDYTIERVFFESFPGHYVTGSLYRPKGKSDQKRPGILCPHGHWKDGRFYLNENPEAELAIGSERWDSGARAPLQARCVQLARMGCVVFHYDTFANADSVQILDHRTGKRPTADGIEPGTFGLYSAMADLRLQSSFGIHTWNSIRSTDFILSLPDVDPTRIAVTGASGGGTQSMILSAVDTRIAASFPCVMISTAMQGGCTCENACYLRIGQGNIDIAAATAPRPIGMTAADDWTVELQTKGFPDLQALYKTLGKPNDVLATFNIHWKHNYNHVSRTTMYGFMSDHLKLGFKKPVLESDFKVASKEELTVWTADHPAPSGDKVGEAHEKALLKHWSEDSDKLLTDSTCRSAWEIMIDRALPAPTDIGYDEPAKTPRGDHLLLTSKLRLNSANEEVQTHFLFPKENWSGTAYLWLSDKGLESLGGTAAPNATAQALLAKGHAIVIPELYLQGSQTAPRLMDKAQDPNAWGHSACYTYGYNPSLIASRVHDTLTTLAYIKNHPKWSVKKIILVGTEGAAPVAAITAALHGDQLTAAAFDTQGFRFAQVRDQYEARFVPGAVKYGDLPQLLKLTTPLKPLVAGEPDTPKSLTSDALLKLSQ